MSLTTSNAYGKISISEEAVAHISRCAALECYGVVGVSSRKLKDSIYNFFSISKKAKGVRVKTVGDRIYIDLSVFLKYGVNIEAVANSLKKSVKYEVERFSGMVVDTINVKILGIKI